MMIVTPLENQVRGNRVLQAGTSYCVYDINAGEMLLAGECHVEQVEPHPLKPWKRGMKALLTRPGGYGDMLFLTPTISALAALGVEVYICCSQTFRPAIEHHPGVAGIHDYPLELSEIGQFDQCCWLEGVLERERELHAVDAMARACGVELESKRCELHIPDAARGFSARFPRAHKRRIGIQVRASQACRTYPAPLLQQVILDLLDERCEVVLFGNPGMVQCNDDPRVINLPALPTPPTFLESCAMLETCDGFIAPDSALCHAAGALDVPTVALYGAFPWQLRTAYAPSIHALTGHCPVSPCFHQERGPGTQWPFHGPCLKSGRCDALAEIPPKRIVAKILELVRQQERRST